MQNLRPSNVKVIFQRPSCDYYYNGGYGFLAPVGQTQCVTSACRGRTPKPTIADIILINLLVQRHKVVTSEALGRSSVLMRKGKRESPGEEQSLQPRLKHSNSVTINNSFRYRSESRQPDCRSRASVSGNICPRLGCADIHVCSLEKCSPDICSQDLIFIIFIIYIHIYLYLKCNFTTLSCMSECQHYMLTRETRRMLLQFYPRRHASAVFATVQCLSLSQVGFL